MDTLRDYIAYARSQCKPKLSEDAAQTLIDGYVDMRRQGVSRKVTVLHKYPVPSQQSLPL